MDLTDLSKGVEKRSGARVAPASWVSAAVWMAAGALGACAVIIFPSGLAAVAAVAAVVFALLAPRFRLMDIWPALVGAGTATLVAGFVVDAADCRPVAGVRDCGRGGVLLALGGGLVTVGVIVWLVARAHENKGALG